MDFKLHRVYLKNYSILVFDCENDLLNDCSVLWDFYFNNLPAELQVITFQSKNAPNTRYLFLINSLHRLISYPKTKIFSIFLQVNLKEVIFWDLQLIFFYSRYISNPIHLSYFYPNFYFSLEISQDKPVFFHSLLF